MVDRSSVRSIVPSPGFMARPACADVLDGVSVTHRAGGVFEISTPAKGPSLLRVTIDDRAEQLPLLAGEFHHLDLLDRIEVGRRGLDADARDIGVDLEV